MPTPLASQIQGVLPRTKDAYYKLVLAVGPARTGKTATLIELSARHSWPRVNVNLRLSERLLELTHRQRATRVAGILDDIVRAEKSDVVLLDNIELLFAGELAQDPLRLLQVAVSEPSNRSRVARRLRWNVPDLRRARPSRSAPISDTPSGDRQSR